jgi:transglutaminase-like putative cysteine protease
VPATIALRLAAFAALATVAAVEWVALVSDPPLWRAVPAVLAVLAGAALLAGIDATRPRRPGWLLPALVALGAIAAAMLVAGLPARTLAPGGWAELGDGIDRGLGGLGRGEYPYEGANDWSRLLILLALPLWLGLAAALAFWPGRAGIGARRGGALAIVVTAYGVAITVNPSGDGAPLVRGSILLAGVAAWLWLPRLGGFGRRGALVGAAFIGAAGALALPLAVRLDGAEAWLDYHDWRWGRGADSRETFDWEHSYGPLDWSRTNAPVLDVRSDEPHYWRTLVLDDFNGYGWRAAGLSGGGLQELPIQVQRGRRPPNPHWVHQIGFTVRSLESPFLVGAGTVLDVEGLSGATSTANGVLLPEDDPLERGDAYAISAYVPDPTAERMRRAPARYPSALERYTTVSVRGSPGGGPLRRVIQVVSVPLRGAGAAAARVESQLAGSPYAPVHRLARRVTRGAPTPFDAAAAIERYLEDNYTYEELTPSRRYPLPAFLFRDRSGYCQQFSGAMALMLRMVGIPARVAAGFSPGSPTDRRGQYRVTDFDAHSWVEVYFSRIGWVAFDPTPAAAPARSQVIGIGAPRVDGSGGELAAPTAVPEEPGSPRPAAGESGGSADLWVLPAALSVLAAAGLVAIAMQARRFRGLRPGPAGEDLLRELESALVGTRWRTSGGATLLALQQRFRGARMPAAAAYVAKLRASRFQAGDPPPPGLGERRALRRELAARARLRGGARGYLAIPPGGPLRRG